MLMEYYGSGVRHHSSQEMKAFHSNINSIILTPCIFHFIDFTVHAIINHQQVHFIKKSGAVSASLGKLKTTLHYSGTWIWN